MSRTLPQRLASQRAFASSSSAPAYDFPRERNPSLWKVLGVKENASIPEVKAAYYQRVRSVHPDAVSSTPDTHPIPAKDRFHLLQTAYETLGNAEKRASYINKSRFGNHAFSSSSQSPVQRRDEHYRPYTNKWTTWEGRTDSGGSYGFHPRRPRPDTQPRTNPELFSFGWRFQQGGQGQRPPWGAYHASKMASHGGVANDRVVTWLLVWMFFGALMATNQVNQATAVHDAHHESAVASLRSAEDSARNRGSWRPLVESRLARYRARQEAEDEAHFQAEVLARMQAEFRAQNPGELARGKEPPTLREAQIRSKEMIEEELRRAEEERRLEKLQYPEGFVGPRQKATGMVRVVARKDGEKGGRPLTGKERRKELQAAGVREPRNPKFLFEARERERRLKKEAEATTARAATPTEMGGETVSAA